jgi:hypothetical protein
MMSMMGMGPLGGLFSGASSLFSGAGDLVGGAGKGAGKGLSAVGSVLSGDAFKPKFKKTEDPFGVCQECAAQNWTGSVSFPGKPVECSQAKAKC